MDLVRTRELAHSCLGREIRMRKLLSLGDVQTEILRRYGILIPKANLSAWERGVVRPGEGAVPWALLMFELDELQAMPA